MGISKHVLLTLEGPDLGAVSGFSGSGLRSFSRFHVPDLRVLHALDLKQVEPVRTGIYPQATAWPSFLKFTGALGEWTPETNPI